MVDRSLAIARPKECGLWFWAVGVECVPMCLCCDRVGWAMVRQRQKLGRAVQIRWLELLELH